MSKIELFATEGFGGDEVKILSDIKDFKSVSNIEEVKSIKVSDGIWIVFSEVDYKGEIAVYKEGDYSHGIKIPRIGSLRKLPGGLEDHIITVYPDTDFKVDCQIFKGESYKKVAFRVFSHEVEKGVWLLYDDTDFGGNSIVSVIGDKFPNEIAKALNGPVKSLKAYTSYE
ncbi:epidermal differentiation-specific protein-like [Anomaloglossus baeobatrachus]|uniref:epidermal differentiation-specific protein-like n=1 Tax=Anomaloglossus baeobatrachus TaxID=238106 RepID=UPI003F50CAD7